MAADVMQFETISKLDFIDFAPQCLQIIYLFSHQRYGTAENRIQKYFAMFTYFRASDEEEQTANFSFSEGGKKKLLRREDILMFFYCHFSIYTVIFFNG